MYSRWEKSILYWENAMCNMYIAIEIHLIMNGSSKNYLQIEGISCCII